MVSRTDHCLDTEELSAFIDDELHQKRHDDVVAHLEKCTACQKTEAALRGLKTSFSKCRDDRPKRDLWPEIAARVSAEKTRSATFRLWFPRLAPIAFTAAAASILAMLLLGQPIEKAQTPPNALDVNRAFVTAAQAEVAYLQAIDSLEQVLAQEKKSLDPETREIVEKSLAEIELAIARCKAAMLKNPRSMETHRAMLAAYREKMDFLFELVGSRIRPEGA